MTQSPPHWPASVHEIHLTDLKKLGIDDERQLFWDGKQVEIRRPLVLTRLQTIAAVLVTVFAVLGGIGGFLSGVSDTSDFLCARNLHWLTCPAPR